ncbi:MAG: hypothetical protein B6245_22310 [Desulfobacteraceae bacterium 4572_88]|nr:MAG: hypothetical protein B6245_22310 [Desulfobacteraceae bacterium 4572_88]
MKQPLQNAFISGVERIAAWADILDRINVFPVADGDTGRNLLISLTPLRQLHQHPEPIIHQLLLSARGNSGNIAARFFSEFLKADSPEMLPRAAQIGRDQAWQAIRDPKPGTMLSVFDALTETLGKDRFEANGEDVPGIMDHLESAVRETSGQLPKLREADVVDAGALGMFIYLEGFFRTLAGKTGTFRPPTAIFGDKLRISPSFRESASAGYCIDMTLRTDDPSEETMKKLSEYGESVVIIPEKDCFKVHLHTDDREGTRKRLASLGQIVRWADDDMGTQVRDFRRKNISQAIHIMTDAAGSVSREDAKEFGITLLNSYISVGDISLPETHLATSELYQAMRKGVRASTSQASVFERHQHYQRVLDQYENVLYLCVGSVFTGNYHVAAEWQQAHDPDGRLTIIDTGAASGRLGITVLATAKYSAQTDDAGAVREFAASAVLQAQEYVFLDKLHYLAAGGRLSKTSAFFGDMFHMKPVITPTAEGAKKVGVMRNQKEQLLFALEQLGKFLAKDANPFIMLEYSDNRSWVEDVVKKAVQAVYPSAHIMLQSLSLTSGVHMGPGTWGIAFL